MSISTEDLRQILRNAAREQRTERGVRYERYKRALTETLQGMTEESRVKAGRLNKDFLRGLADPKYRESYESELHKAIGPVNVHVDTSLATLSVMYANDAFIGEQLMPAVPVSKRSDVFYKYTKRDRLAYPDDEITGARAKANELDQSRTTDNYSVKDYGFKNHLALETIQNQDAPLNEMVDVVEQINEGIAFKREKRILTIVGTSGSYAGTAAAATVWDDSTGGSIVNDLLSARAEVWSGFGPTKKLGFCSLSVWNTGIANNPEILDMFRNQREGLPVTAQVASYFRLDDILISESREDTANSGQAASYARMLTAKVFGIVSVATGPTIRSAHFGSTFRMQGTPITTEWTDPDLGVRGGLYARVAVSEDHKVVANDAGYLITSCIS
jgi:hypothetical protein